MTPERLEALREQHKAGMALSARRALADELFAEIDKLRAELAQAQDRLDDDAWNRKEAVLAAVEQDRDRLGEELAVVRRERAWLLQLVGYDELQEFRLLAQTAERAREDATRHSGTEAGHGRSTL